MTTEASSKKRKTARIVFAVDYVKSAIQKPVRTVIAMSNLATENNFQQLFSDPDYGDHCIKGLYDPAQDIIMWWYTTGPDGYPSHVEALNHLG